MRIPLAFNYGERVVGLDTDEVSINSYAEQGVTGQSFVVKRPGTELAVLYAPYSGYSTVSLETYPGNAQGMYQNLDDVYFARGGRLMYQVQTSGGGSSDNAAIGNDTLLGDYYTFTAIPEDTHTKSFFLKSEVDAFRVYDMVMTEVSDVDYPATTVPGCAYLDGTFYVMTPLGYIYGSELEDPLTWSGLNVIKAGSMPDAGVAICRMVNYVVAFGRYTTEFFYDAANPFGSPLSPVTNAVALVGCANAYSVADAENTVYFMGVAKQQGRSIYRFNGTVPEKVSTPPIDRVLSASTLENVSAYFLKLNGHPMYILTLGDIPITLVFDASTNLWHEWSSSSPGNWMQPGG